MSFQFQKHYTLEQARALLPEVRQWLSELAQLRQRLAQCDEGLAETLAAGNDAGGDLVNRWVRTLSEVKSLLANFQKREIQIKDLERGLIDFPALVGGKEVFLCWEQDEEDIEYWHDLDSGYAGRERL